MSLPADYSGWPGTLNMSLQCAQCLRLCLSSTRTSWHAACTSQFPGDLRGCFAGCSSSSPFSTSPSSTENSSLQDQNSRRFLGSCLALSGQPSMMMFLGAVTSGSEFVLCFSCISLSSGNWTAYTDCSRMSGMGLRRERLSASTISLPGRYLMLTS